jgi:hypothetical protein
MKFRSWWGSNLRSQREFDFEPIALTTRPQLLVSISIEDIVIPLQKANDFLYMSVHLEKN